MLKDNQSKSLGSGVQQEWQNLSKDCLMSIRDSARILGISRDTLRRYMRSGRARGVRVGNRLKLRQSEVLRLIQPEYPDAKTMPVLPERVPPANQF